MKAWITGCLLALAATAAQAQVEIKKENQSYLLGDAQRVHVDFSFGKVEVEGVEGDTVRLTFELTCSREDLEKCRRHAERIRAVPRVKGDRFVVKLENTPRGRLQGIKARLRLEVPRHVPLDVDLGGGDVFVTRMQSHVTIAGGGGDVDVVGDRRLTGEVDLDVVAGKAELWLGDGYIKGSGFPRAVKWQGPGNAKIDVNLGTGDARVRLE